MKKILAALAISAMALTGHAFEVAGPAGSSLDIYTSIRSYGLYQGVDSETTDLGETLMGVQSNSRLGFIFKKDNVYAQIEYNQPMGATSTTYDDTGLRLAYAGFTFAEHSGLYMGQMATLVDTGPKFFRRLYADAGISGFGGLGGPRRPGLKYQVNDNFAVQLLTLKSDSSNYTDIFSGSRYSNVTFEEKLPKIELQYKFDEIPVTLMGAYAYFSLQADDSVTGEKKRDFSTSAYHVAFLADPKIGNFGLKLTGFYAVNGGLYAQVTTGTATSKPANQTIYLNEDGDGVEDVKTYGFGASINYKLDKQSSVELGGGYQSSSSDMYEQDDDNVGVYMNYNYKINKYVQVTPEIGVYDFKQNAAKKGTDPVDSARIIQAGVQLRIDL